MLDLIYRIASERVDSTDSFVANIWIIRNFTLFLVFNYVGLNFCPDISLEIALGAEEF